MNEATIKRDNVVITISEDEADVWELLEIYRAAALALGFSPKSVDRALPPA